MSVLRRLPWFKVLAIGRAGLLARRHLRRLDPPERRRLVELMRHPHRLSQPEKDELRRLVGKLEPRAFALAAANELSPVRLPRRLTRSRK